MAVNLWRWNIWKGFRFNITHLKQSEVISVRIVTVSRQVSWTVLPLSLVNQIDSPAPNSDDWLIQKLTSGLLNKQMLWHCLWLGAALIISSDSSLKLFSLDRLSSAGSGDAEDRWLSAPRFQHETLRSGAAQGPAQHPGKISSSPSVGFIRSAASLLILRSAPSLPHLDPLCTEFTLSFSAALDENRMTGESRNDQLGADFRATGVWNWPRFCRESQNESRVQKSYKWSFCHHSLIQTCMTDCMTETLKINFKECGELNIGQHWLSLYGWKKKSLL